MGAKCAPSIANIYIAILEKNFLVIHKPLFYRRFIDDIFIILSELFNINILVISFEDLKLNVVTNDSVIFLDLCINLDAITGKLIFSLYTKPTNTFAYLLYGSNHPDFIFRNIPKSLFIRLRRICSIYSDFLFYARRLINQLIARGYNKNVVIKTSILISNIDRLDLLEYKQKSDFFGKNNCIFF